MYQFIEKEGNKQTIVALPALGERKDIYEPLVQKMEQFNWVLFDLPGTNKQQLEDYSVTHYTQYIKNVLNQLEIESAHFMGNSIGTWIIQAYYTQYSQDVLSLIMLDGGYFFLGDINSHTHIDLPKIEDFDTLMHAVKNLVNNSPAANKYLYEKYYLNNFVKEDNHYIHHSDEVALNVLSFEVSTVDYRLTETQIPIYLLIASEGFYSDSPQQVDQYIKEFKESNTNTEVYIVEKGQHFLPMTNTEDVVNILLDVLNKSTEFHK